LSCTVTFVGVPATAVTRPSPKAVDTAGDTRAGTTFTSHGEPAMGDSGAPAATTCTRASGTLPVRPAVPTSSAGSGL